VKCLHTALVESLVACSFKCTDKHLLVYLDDLFKSVIIPTILLAPILYTLTIVSVTTLIEIAV
jgi:hypothetical protein